MAIHISTPLDRKTAAKLKAGERVLISGEIYTARDAAHKRMIEALSRGEELPFDIKNQIIYYAGPAPAKPGEVIGSCGPTTSGRMDAYAPSPKGRDNFVQSHDAAAQRVARESGIPASYMPVQAGHETGWGKSEIRGDNGSNSFNLFGIKATGGWTGKVAEITTTEYIDGIPRKVKAKFRAYDSYEDSFRDYARLITENPRYAKAMQSTGSASAYATALQKAGYATDPLYANKLSRAIQSAQSVQQGNQG